MKRYYEVKAKCGHVGMNNYIIKCFYVYANNGSEAAAYVRRLPRVKHDQKDAIQVVTEITFDEYVKGKEKKHNDAFFRVENKQDQMRYCEDIFDFLEREETQIRYKKRNDHKKQHLIDAIVLREWKLERNMIYE